jgi:glycosyltransferase involved in cell wall biosynthesis
MSYSFTIITPTKGRPTLARTLRSATLGPRDEWLVIGDGPQPVAQSIVEAMGDSHIRYTEGPQTGDYGNARRQMGMEMAVNDYLLFIDDDDEYVPGALKTIRPLLNGYPFMFRMVWNGEIIWRMREVYPGNVAAAMFAVPNYPHMLGRWGRGYGADAEFIKETVELWGVENVVWSGDVIVRCHHDG